VFALFWNLEGGKGGGGPCCEGLRVPSLAVSGLAWPGWQGVAVQRQI